jgi:hypothetical protein
MTYSRSPKNTAKIKREKSILCKMKTNKVSHQQPENKLISDNPLANIAGKFGGEFWSETQLAIARSRQADLEETNQILETKSPKLD